MDKNSQQDIRGYYYDLREEERESLEREVKHHEMSWEFEDDFGTVKITTSPFIKWVDEPARSEEWFNFTTPYHKEEIKEPIASDDEGTLETRLEERNSRTTIKVKYRQAVQQKGDKRKFTLRFTVPTSKEGLISENLFSKALVFHCWVFNACPTRYFVGKILTSRRVHVVDCTVPLTGGPPSFTIERLRPKEYFGNIVMLRKTGVTARFWETMAVGSFSVGTGTFAAVFGPTGAMVVVSAAGALLVLSAVAIFLKRRH